MELSDKRAVILAEDLYNEMELWYPYYRLREAGCEVTLVGSGRSKTFHSKAGLPVEVQADADQVAVSDYHAVIIPGGYAPDHMRRYPAMVKLVREFFDRNKVVASICHAGWMLASADIVRGRTVTAFFAIKDDLVNAGAVFIDREVVVDGNLITSRKPDDLPAFMRAVISAMEA